MTTDEIKRLYQLKQKLLDISKKIINEFEGKNYELNNLITYIKGIELEFNHYQNEYRIKQNL